LERFRAKHALGLDPWVDTGSRKENASKQESRAPFRFHRNGKGSRSVSRTEAIAGKSRRKAGLFFWRFLVFWRLFGVE
ncbi:MAG: hypothetical protein KGQ48_15115, partial [Bradyrhizobium sp.]|nr:hypothetical protein [Bradyrhizobium sp.]